MILGKFVVQSVFSWFLNWVLIASLTLSKGISPLGFLSRTFTTYKLFPSFTTLLTTCPALTSLMASLTEPKRLASWLRRIDCVCPFCSVPGLYWFTYAVKLLGFATASFNACSAFAVSVGWNTITCSLTESSGCVKLAWLAS